MLLKIICVGRIKDRAFAQKSQEYAKWLRKFSKIEIIELKDSNPTKEGKNILAAFCKNEGKVIALSEEGKQYSSAQFAKFLANTHEKLIFIIGGPWGISEEVKAQADHLISLSPMTFTHEMARVLILEQLYRAIDINRGGKYHNP